MNFLSKSVPIGPAIFFGLLLVISLTAVAVEAINLPSPFDFWSQDFCPWRQDKSKCLLEKIRLLDGNGKILSAAAGEVKESRNKLVHKIEETRSEDVRELHKYKELKEHEKTLAKEQCDEKIGKTKKIWEKRIDTTKLEFSAKEAKIREEILNHERELNNELGKLAEGSPLQKQLRAFLDNDFKLYTGNLDSMHLLYEKNVLSNRDEFASGWTNVFESLLAHLEMAEANLNHFDAYWEGSHKLVEQLWQNLRKFGGKVLEQNRNAEFDSELKEEMSREIQVVAVVQRAIIELNARKHLTLALEVRRAEQAVVLEFKAIWTKVVHAVGQLRELNGNLEKELATLRDEEKKTVEKLRENRDTKLLLLAKEMDEADEQIKKIEASEPVTLLHQELKDLLELHNMELHSLTEMAKRAEWLVTELSKLIKLGTEEEIKQLKAYLQPMVKREYEKAEQTAADIEEGRALAKKLQNQPANVVDTWTAANSERKQASVMIYGERFAVVMKEQIGKMLDKFFNGQKAATVLYDAKVYEHQKAVKVSLIYLNGRAIQELEEQGKKMENIVQKTLEPIQKRGQQLLEKKSEGIADESLKMAVH